MKIFCIGRNYAAHAQELGNAVPERPVVFMKPPTALLKDGKPFYLPEFSNQMQYETEVVVRIDRNGKHIEPQFSKKYYSKVSIGIDFTARDLQTELKGKGHPWELAKAFDHSAVIGNFEELNGRDVQDLHFQLLKNGELVQTGHTADMRFKVDFIISFLSKYISLQQGDLIYTGTPVGVSEVAVGDRLEGWLGDRRLMQCEVK